MTRNTMLLSIALACAPLLVAGNASAATATNAATMPSWNQLTPAQRDLLLAPVRERWENSPAERARIYEHAQRWQKLSPEQRANAHRGMRRWQHMPPEKRAAMRALFQKMRGMTPEQRTALHAKWRAMTPAQRREWIQANPAAPR